MNPSTGTRALVAEEVDPAVRLGSAGQRSVGGHEFCTDQVSQPHIHGVVGAHGMTEFEGPLQQESVVVTDDIQITEVGDGQAASCRESRSAFTHRRSTVVTGMRARGGNGAPVRFVQCTPEEAVDQADDAIESLQGWAGRRARSPC